jgi:hypothetical protein
MGICSSNVDHDQKQSMAPQTVVKQQPSPYHQSMTTTITEEQLQQRQQHVQQQLQLIQTPPYQGTITTSPQQSFIAPPPYSSTVSNSQDTFAEMFRDFALKFKIPNNFAKKLRSIGDFKIAILDDDSGSMNCDAYDPEFLDNIYDRIPTRFEENKKIVELVINTGGLLSKHPIDIYFMNRGSMMNVKKFEDVAHLFIQPPQKGHFTPTVATLKRIIEDNHEYLTEHKLLIFIATDGEPTNEYQRRDVEGFNDYINWLMNTYSNLYITFIACVSDENLLGLMDDLGDKYKNIGVVDEFQVERKEMMEKHKDEPGFTFTMAEYIVKAMTVAFDPEIKALFKDN